MLWRLVRGGHCVKKWDFVSFCFLKLILNITMIKMTHNLALVFSPEHQKPQLRGVGGALKLMHRRRSKFGW